jgi:hypothetical protein
LSPICRSCGDLFESDRRYHRYCWPCYWELRDAGTWDDEPAHGRPPPRPSSTPPPLELDPRLLRDAIALTHPDRHPPERAKVANAVTAALLELLETARKGKAA